jgi:hypothetical protein
VLTDQLLFDEVLRNRVEIEARQIDQRNTEFFGRRGRNRARVRDLVFDEVGDERDRLLARFFARLLRRVSVEDAVLNQSPRQARERDGLSRHLFVQSLS